MNIIYVLVFPFVVDVRRGRWGCFCFIGWRPFITRGHRRQLRTNRLSRDSSHLPWAWFYWCWSYITKSNVAVYIWIQPSSDTVNNPTITTTHKKNWWCMFDSYTVKNLMFRGICSKNISCLEERFDIYLANANNIKFWHLQNNAPLASAAVPNM